MLKGMKDSAELGIRWRCGGIERDEKETERATFEVIKVSILDTVETDCGPSTCHKTTGMAGCRIKKEKECF
jgi:hypothetical protein